MDRVIKNSDLRPKGFVVVCTECRKPSRAEIKISARGMAIVAAVSSISIELTCTGCGKTSKLFLN